MPLINKYRKQLALAIVLLLTAFTTAAKTWRVSVGGPFSIQQAIDHALPGDTILVNAGRYHEKTITINKPLYLKGVNYPLLDGERKYEVIAIKSNEVTIEGFYIQHAGYSSYNDIAAIRIYNARHVTVRNNKLDDTFFGIYSQHATACIIIGNILHSNAVSEISSANGIHCWKSDSMQILNNNISGHRDGIYFEFVTNSVIKNNNSHENVRYGLHFMFSNNDTYQENTFNNNGAGVAVMFSHGVVMFHNTFSGNWGSAAYGILLKEIADSRIEKNNFLRNTTGIYMEGTSRILVIQNRFDNNGWALKIQASCNDNTITANNFLSNTFDVATNGSLVLNTFNGNYWDKYEGYDLNRDGRGDVPYRPVSLYSMIVERNPTSMMLFRSFMVNLLDKTEKVAPVFIPENLKDEKPLIKPLKW
jgi:nitrous oxidase accessory protein